MTKTLLRVLGLGLALSVIGCGGGGKSKAVKVTGSVKLADGKGLPGGTITFQSDSGDSGSGTIGPDGNYEITIVPGDYKVGVDNSHLKSQVTGAGGAAMPGMPDTGAQKYVAINAKYTKTDTSGLTAKVEKDGQKIDFDLK